MSLATSNWEGKATQELVALGLSWEHARIAVGLIAEHRQTADLQGYARGFNRGYDFCKTSGKHLE